MKIHNQGILFRLKFKSPACRLLAAAQALERRGEPSCNVPAYSLGARGVRSRLTMALECVRKQFALGK